MLVIAIGDFHIPQRAIDLPAKFKKLLVPGKISQVLCLGNVTNSTSTLEFLKNLSPDLQLVKGEFDESSTLPLSLIITHGSLRIGFINGYTIVPRGDPLALLTTARQLNVDVLIWGGTHKVEAYTLEGIFFINPGSATGAFSTDWPEIDDTLEGGDNDEEGETSDKLNQGDKDKADGEVDATQEENGTVKENQSDTNGDKEKDDDKTGTDTVDGPKLQDAKDSNTDEEDEDDDEEDILYDAIPSFTLLDIQGSAITLYIYTYINGEVKVDKVSYRKEQSV